MRIELNCSECGNNHFALHGSLDDETQIRCMECGHEIGTMGELKQKVAAEVLKRGRPASIDATGG